MKFVIEIGAIEIFPIQNIHKKPNDKRKKAPKMQ